MKPSATLERRPTGWFLERGRKRTNWTQVEPSPSYPGSCAHGVLLSPGLLEGREPQDTSLGFEDPVLQWVWESRRKITLHFGRGAVPSGPQPPYGGRWFLGIVLGPALPCAPLSALRFMGTQLEIRAGRGTIWRCGRGHPGRQSECVGARVHHPDAGAAGRMAQASL